MEFENILNQLIKNDNNLMKNMGNKPKADMQMPMEQHTPMKQQMPMEQQMPMKENMEENMHKPMEQHEEYPEMGHVRGAEQGDLPCNAVIGMTYTPMQRKGGRKYTAGEALDRGTLFPGLELPWKNNFAVRNVANTPLGELQALDFALVELGLYLDTHKNDMEAFQLFQRYAKAYHDKKMAYVKTYGPIIQRDAAEADRYNWTDDPWPWDYGDRR